MELIDYCGNKRIFKTDCPGCAFVNHEFNLPCGYLYEDCLCYVSQDWELPINGMIIVAPNRHVCCFEEMTTEERKHIFEITNKVISILRKHNVARYFNVLFEEKENRHFHIWILPRDGWKEKGIDPTKDIRKIQEYSLKHLKTIENFNLISNTCKLIKKEMNKQ